MNRSANRPARILAVIAAVLVAIVAWAPQLDRHAEASLEAGTARAFATFATARGLNAAISLLQGTELSGGVGVSATFSVGQVLDPVNDLVEQFADLMLLATVSFGVQQMLLAMGQDAVVKIALTGLLVAWAAWTVAGRRAPRWLGTALVLGLMARFAIPAAVVGSEVLFEHFLAERYEASEMAVRETRESVDETAQVLADGGEPPEEAAGNAGWWDEWMNSARRKLDEASEWLDVPARLDRLQAQAESTVRNVVELIVVFLLQTLILPLAILWALYLVARGFFGSAGRGMAERMTGGDD